MAKQKTVWVSEDGNSYDREMDAIRADMRHKAQQALLIATDGYNLQLKRIESCNEEHLQPIVEYFTSLILASRERRKIHGQ